MGTRWSFDQLSPAQQARNELGALHRRGASAGELAEARARMERVNADRRIAELVALAPVLTESQRARLRTLLSPVAESITESARESGANHRNHDGNTNPQVRGLPESE